MKTYRYRNGTKKHRALELTSEMKLSCLPDNLVKALNQVKPFVAKRSALPALENILLTAKDGGLEIVGSNLEQSVQVYTGAKVEKLGAIAVPCSALLELAKVKKNTLIKLETKGKMLYVTLEDGGNVQIQGIDSKDFPPFPEVEGESFEIPSSTLLEAINYTAFAVSSDQTRPVLTGIYLEGDGKKLDFVATDGFRLPVYTTELVCNIKAIVPFEAVHKLKPLLKNASAIKVTYNNERIAFEFGNVMVVSQLISGTFPDYRLLIPQVYEDKVTVWANDLKEAVKTVDWIAKAGRDIIRFQSHGDLLQVSAKADDAVASVDIATKPNSEGQFKVGMNSRYVKDIATAMKDGMVSMETIGQSNPVVFRKVGTGNYLVANMPMFVEW